MGILLGILLDPLLVYYWTYYWYIINGILLDPLLYPLVPYPLPLPRTTHRGKNGNVCFLLHICSLFLAYLRGMPPIGKKAQIGLIKAGIWMYFNNFACLWGSICCIFLQIGMPGSCFLRSWCPCVAQGCIKGKITELSWWPGRPFGLQLVTVFNYFAPMRDFEGWFFPMCYR